MSGVTKPLAVDDTNEHERSSGSDQIHGLREREVVAATKLKPDSKGKSKTGANVGAANVAAVKDFDLPVDKVDYGMSDTTASNSSLKVESGKGGALQLVLEA